MKTDRDEIIRMAREAGSIDSEETIMTVYAAFSAAEREEILNFLENNCRIIAKEGTISEAIRARGNA